MTVYKIDDIIEFSFLRVPKSLIAKNEYRGLSSDAKLTYALLCDRLSLSQRNGWINDKGEVYLNYTREAVSEDLGISYKKATKAFKDLVECNLIIDDRPGQGKPNRIYIVKPEISEKDARDFVDKENLRTAESEYQEPHAIIGLCGATGADTPKSHIKNGNTGFFRTAESECQDTPEQRTNKTDINNTDFSDTEFSRSVSRYSLDDIFAGCEIELFDEDVRKMLSNAIEQMFYCKELKVGKAILPGNKVRSKLCELTYSMLEGVVAKLHMNTQKIKNKTGYIMSMIYNSLTDDINEVHTDPFLNTMRGDVRCT